MPNSKPGPNASQIPLPEKLQKLLAATGDNTAFDAALLQAAITRARSFITGINLYRRHPVTRSLPEAQAIWREGSTCLRDYNPTMPEAPIILVVPSLINRYAILDLDHASSFLRSLAMAGYRPLLVDWDQPSPIEQNFSCDDYVKRLQNIVAWIGKKNSGPVHLLGYCMGGLLALALANLQPAAMKTLILMATPWDFHQPDPALALAIAEFAAHYPDTNKAVAGMGVDVIQTLFTLMQPLQSFGKFMDFATLDHLSDEARHFVLLEDWLNDGVPLSLPVAREAFAGWYGKNLTANFAWKIGGKIVDPRQLTMPSYVVVPGRDRIVPPESALPLAKLLPRSTLHEPMTGHIGMMASRTAPQNIWKRFLRWLGEHN